MNFISTFDELNKLYEEIEPKEVVEEACTKKALAEAADEEIFEDGAPAEDATDDAEIEIIDNEPKQVILECDKCGALVIIDEADIKVDEETDLVNVGTECKFCEEKEGYKIIGSVLPYEATIEADEPIEEAFEMFKGPVKWGKLKKNHTLEPVDGTDFKKGDLLVEIPSDRINKIMDDDTACYVTKVSQQGNEVEIHLGGGQGSYYWRPGKKQLVRAIKGKGTQVEEDLAEDEELEELLDIKPSVSLSLDGGQGNDVDVL
jgi:hypothetical protein